MWDGVRVEGYVGWHGYHGDAAELIDSLRVRLVDLPAHRAAQGSSCGRERRWARERQTLVDRRCTDGCATNRQRAGGTGSAFWRSRTGELQLDTPLAPALRHRGSLARSPAQLPSPCRAHPPSLHVALTRALVSLAADLQQPRPGQRRRAGPSFGLRRGGDVRMRCHFGHDRNRQGEVRQRSPGQLPGPKGPVDGMLVN